MAISDKIKNMLNHGGISAANAFGIENLGTVLQTIAAAIDSTSHIKHTVVADDVTAGVVSITLSGAFDSFDAPLLLTSADVARAVTGVAITSTEGVYTLAVSCAAAAATDVLHITVHKTT